MPVSTVLRKLSSFMKPTIRTRSGFQILNHRGHQAVEFAEIQFHSCILITKKPTVSGGLFEFRFHLTRFKREPVAHQGCGDDGADDVGRSNIETTVYQSFKQSA